MTADGAPKTQEQLVDLLLEVRSLAGGPDADPKSLQRQPISILLEQTRTAVRLLVDQKQRQVQAAKDREEEKEKNLLKHLHDLTRQVDDLKESRDEALADLQAWQGKLENSLQDKSNNAEQQQKQSLELQEQLKTANDKIANMEKETKLLYSSTSEFVRRINEQELQLKKAATLEMQMEKREKLHKKGLEACEKQQHAKIDEYERELMRSGDVQLVNEKLQGRIDQLEKQCAQLRRLPALRKADELAKQLATASAISERRGKEVRRLEETVRRLELKLDARERASASLQREYDRLYAQFKAARNEPQAAQPTATTPNETHIEAQLRHKLKEKNEEIERLQKRLKALMVAEKKGQLERAEFSAERERHALDLDEYRQRATRLQMDTEAAEQRATMAEQKLDRAERLGERALAESRSALTLSTAAPMSSYATLPSAGSAANLLRAPRPTSALTGRELPAKDALGARSAVRVGELVRPQSAKR